MADARVTVSGDASGATSALQDTANATGAATEKFRLLSEGVQKAASMALQFAKDSVKAYMESERVTRQLQRATGELSDAFEKQAQILSRENAVDDDVIKKQQTLLAQWGAAPKDIGAATQAILDYAAATGKDAVGATQDLIQSVEMGGGALKRIGVQFDATGKRTEDLRRATDALAKKFAGASKANADTLEGRVDQVKNAFGDLQKAFGGMVEKFDQKTGALKTLAEMLHKIGLGAAIAYDTVSGLLSLKGGSGKGLMLNVAEQFQKAALANMGGGAAAITQPTPIGGGDNTTSYGRQQAAAGPSGADILKGAFSENEKELFGSIEVGEVGALQYQKDLIRKRYDILADDADIKDGIRKMEAQHAQQALEAAQKEAAKWAQMGETLGASFVNALTGELDKLAAGGEFDLAGFIAGLLPMIGGAIFGPLGGAIGGLAGAGIRFATSRRSHDGSWIGVPRYHSGGWLGIGPDESPAVLQSGERVLSRGEVAAMGGPSGVDRAARGGRAAVVVNISGLDTKSTKDFFEDRGGQGFKDSLRSGRGDIARLFEDLVLA